MTVKELLVILTDCNPEWTVHPYEGENYGIRLDSKDKIQEDFIEIDL